MVFIPRLWSWSSTIGPADSDEGGHTASLIRCSEFGVGRWTTLEFSRRARSSGALGTPKSVTMQSLNYSVCPGSVCILYCSKLLRTTYSRHDQLLASFDIPRRPPFCVLFFFFSLFTFRWHKRIVLVLVNPGRLRQKANSCAVFGRLLPQICHKR